MVINEKIKIKKVLMSREKNYASIFFCDFLRARIKRLLPIRIQPQLKVNTPRHRQRDKRQIKVTIIILKHHLYSSPFQLILFFFCFN